MKLFTLLTCARFAMSARSNLPAGQFANVERQVEPFIAHEYFQITLVPNIYILRSKQVYRYIAEAIDDNENLCIQCPEVQVNDSLLSCHT